MVKNKVGGGCVSSKVLPNNNDNIVQSQENACNNYFIQTEGTCWFHASLNALFVSEEMSKFSVHHILFRHIYCIIKP